MRPNVRFPPTADISVVSALDPLRTLAACQLSTQSRHCGPGSLDETNPLTLLRCSLALGFVRLSPLLRLLIEFVFVWPARLEGFGPIFALCGANRHRPKHYGDIEEVETFQGRFRIPTAKQSNSLGRQGWQRLLTCSRPRPVAAPPSH